MNSTPRVMGSKVCLTIPSRRGSGQAGAARSHPPLSWRGGESGSQVKKISKGCWAIPMFPPEGGRGRLRGSLMASSKLAEPPPLPSRGVAFFSSKPLVWMGPTLRRPRTPRGDSLGRANDMWGLKAPTVEGSDTAAGAAHPENPDRAGPIPEGGIVHRARVGIRMDGWVKTQRKLVVSKSNGCRSIFLQIPEYFGKYFGPEPL